MEKKINGVQSIESTEFSIKSAQQLLPVDITLHPIYRPDGMMLVNRYTALMPFMLTQIQKHLKDDMPIPIVVASSETMLKSFIDNEIYSKPEFVMMLDNVLRESIQCYSVPISIESYVDERVDLKLSMKAIAEIKASLERTANEDATSKKDVEKIDIKNMKLDKYSILGKITSASVLWSNFEKKLISREMQDRAVTFKKKFLNVINVDNTLMEMTFKMSLFDESLLSHGVNTMCVAMLLGLALGIGDEELLNLAITAMFCNIGFINMEKEKFVEYRNGTNNDSVIGEHIKNSLEILAAAPICRNKSVIFGILEHHECFDGKGLPAAKKGKDISLFGRILAIALKYESYVNEFINTDESNLNNIEKMICKNRENKYDQEILYSYMRYSSTFN